MIAAMPCATVYESERYFNGRVHTLFMGKHWVSAKELEKAVSLAERIFCGTVVYNIGREACHVQTIEP